MADKDNNNFLENIEEDGKSEPAPHRERSPSVMSQSSAVLEWDPSADVGAMSVAGTSREQPVSDLPKSNEISALNQISDCKGAFGSSFKLEALHQQSESESSHSTRSKICAFSTPSSSGVPLANLQFSPIHSSINRERKSDVPADPQSNVNSRRNKTPEVLSINNPNNAEDSTDDNNNDEFTEGRLTPGRIVSEASTDWEYDYDKHLPPKSLSQWQTSGMTRSEIEYQNKKNGTSSTSGTSSVFLIQVEAQMKSQASGNERASSSAAPVNPGKPNKNEVKSERKLFKTINRHHTSQQYSERNTGTSGSSDSNPSTMCMVIDQFMKIIEADPSKENMKHDILLKHRDYHMIQVKKQIAKLEKLNRALLSSQRNAFEEEQRKKFEAERRALRKELSCNDAVKIDIPPRPTEQHNVGSFEHLLERKKSKDKNFVYLSRHKPEVSGEESYEYQLERKKREEEHFVDMIRQKSEIRGAESLDHQLERKKRENEHLADRIPQKSEIRGAESRKHRLDQKTRGEQLIHVIRHESGIREAESLEHQSERKKTKDKHFGDLNRHKRENRDAKTGWKISIQRDYTSDPSVSGRSDKPPPRPLYATSGRADIRTYSCPALNDIQSNTDCRDPCCSALRDLISKAAALTTQKVNPPNEKPRRRKSPIGFYVPIAKDNMDQSAQSNEEPEQQPSADPCDIQSRWAIEEYLKRNRPQTYRSIKERDDFLLHVKRDRQACNETVLRDVINSHLSPDEILKYLEAYYKNRNVEEKKRIETYWDKYLKAQEFKRAMQVQTPHVIATDEMKERTARLRLNDHVILERKTKEAEERRRKASRTKQKKFSTNLRQYQRIRNVNVPDRMKIGPPE